MSALVEVQKLTREVRNATGYERTPSQVVESLLNRGVKSMAATCRKLCDDRNLLLAFAKELQLKDQADIESSVDLNMGF